MNFRFIHSDNATLKDYSTEMNDYYSGTAVIDYFTGQDYIYIGSRFPFNSFYLKVASVNAVSATPTIEYWGGNEWETAVEIIDETASSGVPLAQDGWITFTPDKQEGWNIDDTIKSNGSEEIDGLGSISIYDHYWVRISYSATLTSTTELSFIGYIFSNDNHLKAEYIELTKSTFLDAYESGKTNWEEQHLRASEVLIDDLISDGIVNSGNQLLDRRKLIRVNVCKAAELIYDQFGDDYIDQRDQALIKYNKRKSKGIFNVDINNNAIIDQRETTERMGRLIR